MKRAHSGDKDNFLDGIKQKQRLSLCMNAVTYWRLHPLFGTSESPRFQSSAAMYVRSALCWDITQRRVVILYRRFGTTYWSLPQWSRLLKMGPIRCPETSVKYYHLTSCVISQQNANLTRVTV
jgi:hypothetical protein